MALNEESRLLSMRVLQNFVRETKGSWKPQQWQKLIQRVRRAGFEKVQESRIGQLVKDNRERWLSGDNSVGPPAGDKDSVQRGKEKKMPEKKPEPSRAGPSGGAGTGPAPARPAAPAAATPRAAPAKPAPSRQVQSTAPAVSSRDVAIDSAEAEEQSTRRLARLKRSLDLVNELTDMEVDIRRLENTQAELQRNLDRLEGQRSPLDEQRSRLQGEVDTATKDIGRLRSTIDKQTTQRAALEESVGHRKRERSEHVGAIAGFKAEKEGLIT